MSLLRWMHRDVKKPCMFIPPPESFPLHNLNLNLDLDSTSPLGLVLLQNCYRCLSRLHLLSIDDPPPPLIVV